jgi:hypothetical protein
LWKRFRNEYLGLLFQKLGKKEPGEVKVGDVVMIGCNNKTRLDWVLGLVVSLSFGSDGCVQVVRVKTALG